MWQFIYYGQNSRFSVCVLFPPPTLLHTARNPPLFFSLLFFLSQLFSLNFINGLHLWDSPNVQPYPCSKVCQNPQIPSELGLRFTKGTWEILSFHWASINTCILESEKARNTTVPHYLRIRLCRLQYHHVLHSQFLSTPQTQRRTSTSSPLLSHNFPGLKTEIALCFPDDLFNEVPRHHLAGTWMLSLSTDKLWQRGCILRWSVLCRITGFQREFNVADSPVWDSGSWSRWILSHVNYPNLRRCAGAMHHWGDTGLCNIQAKINIKT